MEPRSAKCSRETMACRHNNIFINWSLFFSFCFTCCEETFQNMSELFLVCSFPNPSPFIAHTNQPIQLFFFFFFCIDNTSFKFASYEVKPGSREVSHFAHCIFVVALKYSCRKLKMTPLVINLLYGETCPYCTHGVKNLDLTGC